jgi:hypothetical protein
MYAYQKMNSELYKTTIDSFGVKKPSKHLIAEARKVAMGKECDMKLVKKEIALCKLTEKSSVTPKQQERINKLAADIDEYLAKKNQPKKLPPNRSVPINPRVKPNPERQKKDKDDLNKSTIEC